MLIWGYEETNPSTHRNKITEAHTCAAATQHQQDGWDLIAVVPRQNAEAPPYVVYVMAKKTE